MTVMDDDNIIIEEDESLKKFMPSGFGKQTDQINRSAQLETARRAAEKPQQEESVQDDGSNDDDDSDDSDDDDDDDDNPEDDYPISHELVIKTHDKAVTTMACDASGARLVSGSTDCTIRLHDFASMTPTTVRAFKTVDPTATKTSATQEVHPIHHVSFNPLSPASMLVVSASSQAKIFSRDGDEQLTFIKGDMYLRDMHNTKGHVSEITSGSWCPTDMNLLVTSGTDSTLRIWDVNNHRSQKEVIVHNQGYGLGWKNQNDGGFLGNHRARRPQRAHRRRP